MHFYVHLLPQLIPAAELAGSTCVVIDVLRATTTIAHALAAGAREVLPCLTVEEARLLAARFDKSEVILGGERGGTRIEGFDFGNSPTDYTPESVGGKTIVFTTTNGTAAMRHCTAADAIWLAAFTNLRGLCEKLRGLERLDIVCAGTGGKITAEDVLLAGAIVDRLLAGPNPFDQSKSVINDQARLARLAWRAAVLKPTADASDLTTAMAAALRDTQGGRNLMRLGLEADIDVAAQIDRFSLVPRLLLEDWRIVAG